MRRQKVIKQKQRHPPEPHLRPKHPHTYSAPRQYRAAHQQHDPLRNYGNRKRQQRQHNQRELAFASTVVRSDTGSDFQNIMLRSRRSPCKASRQ